MSIVKTNTYVEHKGIIIMYLIMFLENFPKTSEIKLLKNKYKIQQSILSTATCMWSNKIKNSQWFKVNV